MEETSVVNTAVERVFAEILEKEKWPEENKLRWVALLAEVQESDAGLLKETVETAWNTAWDAISRHEEKSEMEEQQEWLRMAGSELLETFLVKQFVPEVSVADLKDESLHASAEAMLKRLEYKHLHRIRGRITQQFEGVLETLPGALTQQQRDEVRCAFLQEKYFEIVQGVLEEKVEEEAEKFVFVPVMALEEVYSGAGLEAKREFWKNVEKEEAESIQEAVEVAWEAFVKKCPPWMVSSVESMRGAWLKENYYKLAEEAVLQCRATKAGEVKYEYHPPVLPEQLSSEKAQKEARDLLSKVTEQHVGPIAEVVEEAWKVFFAGQPAFMKDFEVTIRMKWLQEHFYDFVRSIVEVEDFKYVPLICPDVLPTAEARTEALFLLSCVKQEHVLRIEEEVQEQFESYFGNQPAWVKDLKEEMRHAWLEASYFGVVRSVVEQPKSGVKEPSSRIGTGEGVKRKSDGNVCSMLHSPKKQKAGAVVEEVGKTPTYVDVKEIYESQSVSEAFVLEAYVLLRPEATRTVEVYDNKEGRKIPVSVANLLLTDGAGPVMLELWRDKAVEVVAFLEEAVGAQDVEGEYPLLVEVKYFKVKEEPRRCLVNMRRIASVDRTELRILEQGTRPSVKNVEQWKPAESMYTKDFTLLQKACPYTVHICAVIAEVTEKKPSSTGTPMRSFQIVDEKGRFVNCFACGRHVENETLCVGNEVILYFAQGTASGKGNGRLWIYDEGHIVKLRSSCKVPALIEELKLA